MLLFALSMSVVVLDISYITVNVLITHYMPVCSIVTVSLNAYKGCHSSKTLDEPVDKTYPPESLLSFAINITGHI